MGMLIGTYLHKRRLAPEHPKTLLKGPWDAVIRVVHKLTIIIDHNMYTSQPS